MVSAGVGPDVLLLAPRHVRVFRVQDWWARDARDGRSEDLARCSPGQHHVVSLRSHLCCDRWHRSGLPGEGPDHGLFVLPCGKHGVCCGVDVSLHGGRHGLWHHCCQSGCVPVWDLQRSGDVRDAPLRGRSGNAGLHRVVNEGDHRAKEHERPVEMSRAVGDRCDAVGRLRPE